MQAGIRRLHCRTRERRTVTVHLVAGKTRNRRLVCEFLSDQFPWAVCVDGRDQIANAALEMHRVAAKAVVH